MIRYLLISLAFVMLSPAALGQAMVRATLEPVTVCPANDEATDPPDFSEADCETMSFWQVNPQGQSLWIEASFMLSEDELTAPGPRGIYVSGVASSETWLNGHFIGANGQPGLSREIEVVGRMDAVHYAPQALLLEGRNTLVLRMSGHHGVIDLAAPLHVLGFGSYEPPTAFILRGYWPSLMMVSVFALSALVFAVMALRSESREGPAILMLLSVCLGLMLLTEASRGLTPYAYPMHALRLMGIAGFGWLAGVSLIAHVLQRFCTWSAGLRWSLVLGAAIVSALPLMLSSGFDGKTGYSILSAMMMAAGVCIWFVLRQVPGAPVYVMGLIGAGLVLFFTQQQFLDFHLYWISAAFLFSLFVRQALALVRERRQRVKESERASRLDAALAQAQLVSAPTQLKLVSGSKTEFVSTDEIVSLNGAGDYVELRFKSGRTALHNATLSELEKALPNAFLRVHRSCIVNTAFVESLEREESGGGRLALSGGSEAPVSRRIMPKVKTALEAGAA